MGNRNRIYFCIVVLAVIGNAGYAQDPEADLTEGLIAYWKFDDETNKGKDSGSGRLDLTIFGQPLLAADGLFGKALELHHGDRGSRQYAVRHADDPVFDFGTRPFTIQAWVRYHDTRGEQVIIEKFDGPRGWTLTKLGDNRIRFDSASVGITAGEGGPPNRPIEDRWNHIVIVRRPIEPAGAHETRLFLNGVLIGHRRGYSPKNAVPDTPSTLRVGTRFDRPDWGTSGKLDEIAVWARGLSDEAVSKLFNGGQGLELQPQQ